MKLKKILKPQYGIAIAPVIFAFSQVIILGYNWTLGGHFGDLKLTISRYVGLNLWTCILFAIYNLMIAFLMLRYYLYAYKNLSKIWLVLGIVQLVGFVGLSFLPHVEFPICAKLFIVIAHIFLARMMFFAMFGMGLERLRLACKSDNRNKYAAKICLAFLIYGIIYVTGYSLNLDFLWNTMLLWETGYIYAFMAMLILTRK